MILVIFHTAGINEKKKEEKKKFWCSRLEIILQYNYCIAGSWAGRGARALGAGALRRWARGASRHTGAGALGAGAWALGAQGERALGRVTRRRAAGGRTRGARGRGARGPRHKRQARARERRHGHAGLRHGRGAVATRPRGCCDTATVAATRRQCARPCTAWAWSGVLAGLVRGSCSQFGFLPGFLTRECFRVTVWTRFMNTVQPGIFRKKKFKYFKFN